MVNGHVAVSEEAQVGMLNKMAVENVYIVCLQKYSMDTTIVFVRQTEPHVVLVGVCAVRKVNTV